VSVAPEGFDARFSALRRRYLYRLCDQPQALDPLRRRDTVLVSRASCTGSDEHTNGTPSILNDGRARAVRDQHQVVIVDPDQTAGA